MNFEKEFEVLTITNGHFSEAGNFMGLCIEKLPNHAPLHIFKAQLKTFGWENAPNLPFFALGKWKEIRNKPGNYRFTALSIWKSKEDCEKALKSDYDLNNLVKDAIEKKKSDLDI